MKYLKKAMKTPATGEDDTRARVESMLKDIESGGEACALHYAQSLDGWTGDVVVTAEEIARASEFLPQRMKDDIAFAHGQVRTFAEAQLSSMHEFETELHPGVIAGQKLIPVETAGCYIPGGRYAHIASAIMSVTTARVAGVRHVIACSPAARGRGVHPAILHTAHLAGADTILALGGVQGVASLAFGLFTGHAADILVGPGNRFVAEAKRILFGAGRHRSVRGTDGDRGHRGRDRGCGDRRERPGGAGGARARLAGVAGDHLAGAGRTGHGPNSALHRTPGRTQPHRGDPSVARLRRGSPGGFARGGGPAQRRLRTGAPGSAGRRPRLVARPAAQLRLAVPRRGDEPSPTATSPPARITSCRPGGRRATPGA